MSKINLSSVMTKVSGWAKSKDGQKRIADKIEEYRKSGIERTYGGGSVITIENMCMIAEEMIKSLQSLASQHSLPDSVQRHFASLTYDFPRPIDGDKTLYNVEIYFQDDMSRMSLLITSGRRAGQRTGDGINNIVALFNNGYQARSQVFGVWSGREELGSIGSRQSRDGLHFMQQAVSDFNIKYGAKYNVVATVASSDYE